MWTKIYKKFVIDFSKFTLLALVILIIYSLYHAKNLESKDIWTVFIKPNNNLFDVGNTKQICKFITELLTNKKLREIMGKNSWNSQQKNFTLSKQISDYESVYNKILEN